MFWLQFLNASEKPAYAVWTHPTLGVEILNQLLAKAYIAIPVPDNQIINFRFKSSCFKLRDAYLLIYFQNGVVLL